MLSISEQNTNIWASLLWISGGKLNMDKCFYYWIQPEFSYGNNRIQYASTSKPPGEIQLIDPATKTPVAITRVEPNIARRTLGVMLATDGNCKLRSRHVNPKPHSLLEKSGIANYQSMLNGRQ
jgi:hypothetical protein